MAWLSHFIRRKNKVLEPREVFPRLWSQPSKANIWIYLCMISKAPPFTFSFMSHQSNLSLTTKASDLVGPETEFKVLMRCSLSSPSATKKAWPPDRYRHYEFTMSSDKPQASME